LRNWKIEGGNECAQIHSVLLGPRLAVVMLSFGMIGQNIGGLWLFRSPAGAAPRRSCAQEVHVGVPHYDIFAGEQLVGVIGQPVSFAQREGWSWALNTIMVDVSIGIVEMVSSRRIKSVRGERVSPSHSCSPNSA
jgi:hypothetical protein